MQGIAASVRAVCAIVLVTIAIGFAHPSASLAQSPTPTPGGPCCLAHDGPGCDNPDCQNCVCAADPVCCITEWDTFCAETRTITRCPDECGCSVTPGPTPTPGGDCCSARNPEVGGTGCDDPVCQACVCGADPLCCSNIWDADCVLSAQEECDSSCPCAPLPTPTATVVPTPGGDCCEAHEGPSCDDSECRACVCDADVDPECCSGVWDSRCVEEAGLDCALHCACGSTGDCCAAHDPGVGCEDARCKNCVCDLDPACCTVDLGWDADCVSEANVECAADCTCEPAGSCCDQHFDTVGCDDTVCQDCVCAIDAECCTLGWDERCAEEAATDCNVRCTACQSCCQVNESPGCSDNDCEACVCQIDSPCCETTGVWDGQCVSEAMEQCASTCQCQAVSGCPGDCDGSDEVGINELINCVNIALGNAQPSLCQPCDGNGDGDVAINELINAVSASLTGCP